MGCDGRTSSESDIANVSDEPRAVILGVVNFSLPHSWQIKRCVCHHVEREMSARFLCGIVCAITCLCGCSDDSSKQQPLELGSHTAQDEAIIREIPERNARSNLNRF